MPSCNFLIAVPIFSGTPHLFSKRNHKTLLSTESKAFFQSTKRKKIPILSPLKERKYSKILRMTKRPSADPCSGQKIARPCSGRKMNTGRPTCVFWIDLLDRFLSAPFSNMAWISDAMLSKTMPRQFFQSLRAPLLLHNGRNIASNHDISTFSHLQNLRTMCVINLTSSHIFPFSFFTHALNISPYNPRMSAAFSFFNWPMIHRMSSFCGSFQLICSPM